ncbi:NEDD4-binding protein 2-like [Dioscorea cayenensis subsp. rotundata]|uniref:NEDD4-binding protein 2-like n=1 Tax=Dioscorea cayennensis subsp. rotundata TaxID=55577 RepID=A0AB40CZF7_DIOCR|nr:NEDD4-binding protein 2-like [Dioscorea cayenensis subsp. rotundata]
MAMSSAAADFDTTSAADGLIKNVVNWVGKYNFDDDSDNDDDNSTIYYTHRKDALNMSRMASEHARESSEALRRGDRNKEYHLSLMAHEESICANKLHQKAAEEIMRKTNKSNNIWKLDLHCLHASEAVDAVKQRLKKLEASPRTPLKSLSPHCQPNVLTIITGVGKHSRGSPVLPGAVKEFLTSNRYRFYDLRPGVITVYPKFVETM